MKKTSVLLACLYLLLAFSGCGKSDTPSTFHIPAVSGDGLEAELPAMDISENEMAFSTKADLPQGCNGLEVYAFGYAHILCRAMLFDFEDATYLSEDIYMFKLHQPSVYMWDYQIEGYDGLSVFQDEGGLAAYYKEVVEMMGYFPPQRMSFEFEDEESIRYLHDAFFTSSGMDITTGEVYDDE